MSLELDNINEQNEEKKTQELEQFGVWIKKTASESSGGKADNSEDISKPDFSSDFDDPFSIPSSISSADGFESASFSDLSDFNIPEDPLIDNEADKQIEEEWTFDTSDLDIPDIPELNEEETNVEEEDLPISAAEAPLPQDQAAHEEPEKTNDSIDETRAEDTISEEEAKEIPPEENINKPLSETDVPDITKEERIQDPFSNDFIPSAATNVLDISDLSDFDFGDDSSFPVPDSITGQSYIEGLEEKTPRTDSEEIKDINQNTDFSDSVLNTEEEGSIKRTEEDSKAEEDNLIEDISMDSFIDEAAEAEVTDENETVDTAAEDPPVKVETEKKEILSGYEEVSLADLSAGIELPLVKEEKVITPQPSLDQNSFDMQEEPGEELFGDIQFEDITSSIPIEKPVVPKAEEIDEVAEAIFNNETEEIDIDSFLNDSPPPKMGGTEEISLEDFMSDSDFSDVSEFQDFISSTTTEKSDILDDPPIEMSLSFDDSFVLETESKAEDDIETDIPITEDFISDIVTTSEEGFDNFDDIFENITDMNAPQEPEPQVEEKHDTSVTYDEVSEFDDLLSSFEDSAVSTEIPVVTQPSKTNKKVDFDIQVNLDESEIKQEVIETPSDSEEDIAVSLYTDSEYKKTAISSGSVSSQASSFSMADIDDSISFVDETTDSPASSLIDDLSFAGIEVVDITENPTGSIETKETKEEATSENDADVIADEERKTKKETEEASDTIIIEDEKERDKEALNDDNFSPSFDDSNSFDFPEINDELFEKAMSVALEPEDRPDETIDIPEDEPSSDISFDDLPDVDDLFESSDTPSTDSDLPSLDDIPVYIEENNAIEENNNEEASAGLAAGLLGAGIVGATEAFKEKEERPVVENFDIPSLENSDLSESDDSFDLTDIDIPVNDDDFNFTEEELQVNLDDTATEPVSEAIPEPAKDEITEDFNTEELVSEPAAEEIAPEPAKEETLPEELAPEPVADEARPETAEDIASDFATEEIAPDAFETPAADFNIDEAKDFGKATEASAEEEPSAFYAESLAEATVEDTPSSFDADSLAEATAEEESPVIDEAASDFTTADFDTIISEDPTANIKETSDGAPSITDYSSTLGEESIAPESDDSFDLTDIELPVNDDDFNFTEEELQVNLDDTATEPVSEAIPEPEKDEITEDFNPEELVSEPAAEEIASEPAEEEAIPAELAPEPVAEQARPEPAEDIASAFATEEIAPDAFETPAADFNIDEAKDFGEAPEASAEETPSAFDAESLAEASAEEEEAIPAELAPEPVADEARPEPAEDIASAFATEEIAPDAFETPAADFNIDEAKDFGEAPEASAEETPSAFDAESLAEASAEEEEDKDNKTITDLNEAYLTEKVADSEFEDMSPCCNSETEHTEEDINLVMNEKAYDDIAPDNLTSSFEEKPEEASITDFEGNSMPQESSFGNESPEQDEEDKVSPTAIGAAAIVTATTAGVLGTIQEDNSESNELNTTNELDVVENCIYNDKQGGMEVISDMNDFDMNADNTIDNSTENPVIDKIVKELSSLRNEMASMKAELDILKKAGTENAAVPNDIKLPETESNESTGFFSGEEDDETIALSGDELNNILNSADFTEETAEPVLQDDLLTSSEEIKEEPVASIPEENTATDNTAQVEDDLAYENGEGPDTSIDFDENVTEPVIDDINFDIDNDEHQTEENIPDEIDIPSNNDSFVVDASSTDFLDDKVPTLDEALSSDKVSYLNEESSDNVSFDEAKDEKSEGFVPITQEELTSTFDHASANEIEDTEEEIDDTPAESVFEGEQWEQESFADQESDEIPEELPEEEPLSSSEAAAEPSMSDDLKNDVKSVLSYMDQLLENLPEEKIAEFARSEHFEVYKKLFTELGLA
ncbi:MAG: hypothetical protein K5930_06260 [Treponemataceae bacterium]|nr:hypothetical protein [Treponemataceae bacterium]